MNSLLTAKGKARLQDLLDIKSKYKAENRQWPNATMLEACVLEVAGGAIGVRILNQSPPLPITEIYPTQSELERLIATPDVDHMLNTAIHDSYVAGYWILSSESGTREADQQSNSLPLQGISLKEAALILANDDEEQAGERAQKWMNQKSVVRPNSIGFHERHKQIPIYEPAATVTFIKKVEGYLPMAETVFVQRLIAISKPPRKNK